MQEERQLSWSLQTREPATSLSGTRDLLDGLFCESVHLMTILNIAKILMNMKSSWFSDIKLLNRTMKLEFPNTSNAIFSHALVAGIDRYPRKVTKKMSKKKIQKRSKVKPFLKVCATGTWNLKIESDDTWPKLQRFYGKWVLFLVSDLYPKIVHVLNRQFTHGSFEWLSLPGDQLQPCDAH